MNVTSKEILRNKTCQFYSSLIVAGSDVQCLFTKITSQYINCSCVENLFKERYKSIDGLSSIIVTQSFILFDNKYYRQQDGVGTSSSLGLTFPSTFFVYMKLLHSAIELLDLQFIYKWVVGNVLLLFDNKE